MPHETLLKFNYPNTLLREYTHWAVLLRPQQVTLGSLVLVCRAEVTSMAEVPAEAFAELQTVTADLEGTLKRVFAFDKINYLLLMMVDKHVHFHVIPRYATLRTIGGGAFSDRAWPKPPDVTQALQLTEQQGTELFQLLRTAWPAARD